MKNLFLIVVSVVFFTTTNMDGQVSVNVNFGTPPVWAPTDRVETQYYYLPDIDVYYDVPQQQYIYISNRRWIRSNELPLRYRDYNLRGGKVVYLTDYRGNSPYSFHKDHKVKYYRSENAYVYKHDNGRHGNGERHGKGNGKHGRN